MKWQNGASSRGYKRGEIVIRTVLLHTHTHTHTYVYIYIYKVDRINIRENVMIKYILAANNKNNECVLQ